MVQRKGKRQPWKPVPTRVTVETEPPDVDPKLVDEAPEQDAGAMQDDEDIDDVLGALPQEARVELSRWSEQVQDWTYAGRHPAQGFSLDMVARKFGAGRFRMVIRGPVEGKMRIRAKRVFHIDPGMVPTVAATPDATGGLGLSMADMLRMNLDLMRTMITAKPQESMTDVVRAVVDLVKPSASAQQPLSVQDMIALMNAGKKDSSTVEEILDVLQYGIKIAEGREPEDGLGSFARAAGKLVEKLSEKPEAHVPVPPVVPTPPLTLVRPEPPTPARLPIPVDPVREFFGSLVPLFAAASRQEADPELYAALLVDQIPPELDPAVEQWINLPDYPEALVPHFPPSVDPGWLRRVLSEARILLTSEDPGDDDAATAAPGGRGNPPDAPGNGGTGERGSN